MSRSAAIFRHELRVLRRDPMPLVLLIGMPVVLMAFLKSAFRITLATHGYPNASGAEQAVPGMAVMFAFFMVAFVGFSFFREYGWGTWDRLRASPASSAEVIIGKLVPNFVIVVSQLAALFSVGVGVFGLHIRGSLGGLVLVIVALSTCVVAFGLVLTALCRTVQQLNALGNLSALVFAGLGGALVPIELLPGWAHAVAPAVPTYWAMRGFQSIVLGGKGVRAILLPAAVLFAFALGFALVAALRFSFEEVKTSWA